MEKIEILDIKGSDGYFHYVSASVKGDKLSIFDSYDSYGSDSDHELVIGDWRDIASLMGVSDCKALLERIKELYGQFALDKVKRLCEENGISYTYNFH